MRRNRRIKGSVEPCIYCTSTQPRSKREHVMPQAVGTFEQNWTLDCVCDDCNKYFGDNFELPLGRDSLEAILRVQHGVKPSAALDKILYRRLSLFLQATGPFDGIRLTMAAVDGEIRPDAPAQVALRVPGGEWQFITEQQLTRKRIEEVSREQLEIRLFGRAGTDDTRRLVQRLSELGVPFQETASLLDQPLVDGPSLSVVHDLDIDVTLQRAIAKINFNYLAYTLGAAVARKPVFDTVRRFVRHAEASHRLVTAQEASVLVGPGASDSRAHVCGIGWEPSRRILVGIVSLFNTLTYGVQLATPGSDEWTTTCVVHAFDPIARTISALATGE
jgi:hypothetical protein